MAKEYYCLVSGLKEYSLEADHKGFDALGIREEVCEGVSGRDLRHIEMLYTYYDIENIINLKAGRTMFNSLGNFTQEQLTEQVAKPTELPGYITQVLEAYAHPDNTDYEEVDRSKALERSLLEAFYEQCSKSKCKFIKQWYEFDQNLRNVCAAYTARRADRVVGEVLVGSNLITDSLSRSSAADFGLKGEIDYIDQIVAAVDEGSNLIDKEHKIDLVRWNMSDELTTFDYFNINRVLSYLVKVNIVHRWAALDAKVGREMFERLISSLSGKEVIESANKNE